jgi:hypothetical protein
MEGSKEQGGEQQGAEQMDIKGNQQMDLDNCGEHETKTDGVEATDRHETGDSTTSGFRCRYRRRSHAVMPPLVPDSEDGTNVIKPIDDG